MLTVQKYYPLNFIFCKFQYITVKAFTQYILVTTRNWVSLNRFSTLFIDRHQKEATPPPFLSERMGERGWGLTGG